MITKLRPLCIRIFTYLQTLFAPYAISDPYSMVWPGESRALPSSAVPRSWPGWTPPWLRRGTALRCCSSSPVTQASARPGGGGGETEAGRGGGGGGRKRGGRGGG